EAARRPDRREPERRGQDDRVRVLGAPAAGRARLDAARMGRGRSAPARPGLVHHGGRARAGRAPRRPAPGDAEDAAVALEGARAARLKRQLRPFTPSTTSCTAIAESSRPKTRVSSAITDGRTARVTRSATSNAMPTQVTATTMPTITATWPSK